jgi:hypothetical protein
LPTSLYSILIWSHCTYFCKIAQIFNDPEGKWIKNFNYRKEIISEKNHIFISPTTHHLMFLPRSGT